MNIKILYALAHLGAALPGHILAIAAGLLPKLDGGLSAEEAEALAVQLSKEAGDLKVKVKGQDIVDDKAQEHFAAGVGRVVFIVVTILTK